MCVRVFSVTSSWLVFGGGMPRANYSDRHTVSVVHGSSHVTFDFSSRVVDFLMLSASNGTLCRLNWRWSVSVAKRCRRVFVFCDLTLLLVHVVCCEINCVYSHQSITGQTSAKQQITHVHLRHSHTLAVCVVIAMLVDLELALII